MQVTWNRNTIISILQERNRKRIIYELLIPNCWAEILRIFPTSRSWGLFDSTCCKREYRDIVLKRSEEERWKDARDVGGRLEISRLEVDFFFRRVFSLAPKISSARPTALTRQNMIAWRSSVDELRVARILISREGRDGMIERRSRESRREWFAFLAFITVTTVSAALIDFFRDWLSDDCGILFYRDLFCDPLRNPPFFPLIFPGLGLLELEFLLNYGTHGYQSSRANDGLFFSFLSRREW